MLARTVADVAFDEDDKVRQWADFIGDPIIALLIGVLVALFTFGFARGFDRDNISRVPGRRACAPTAAILLIIGAGGGFKGVLVDSGIGDAIAKGVESAEHLGADPGLAGGGADPPGHRLGHGGHRHRGRHHGADRGRRRGRQPAAAGAGRSAAARCSSRTSTTPASG